MSSHSSSSPPWCSSDATITVRPCPASRGSCARSFQAGRRDARSPSSRILSPGAMVPKHQILNEVTVPHSLERQGN